MSSLETFKNVPEEEEGEHMAVISTAGRIFKTCQQRYSYAHELWRRCQKKPEKESVYRFEQDRAFQRNYL